MAKCLLSKTTSSTRFRLRKILNFEHFYFLSKSGRFSDYDSTGSVEHSVVFLFYNPKWTNSSECFRSGDLPEFFAKKTPN